MMKTIESPLGHLYYREHLDALLAGNEPFFLAMKKALPEIPGLEDGPEGKHAQDLLQKAWQSFVEWVLELPYIGGGENFLTGSFVFGALVLCAYLEFHKHGFSDEQVGQLIYEAALEVFPARPALQQKNQQIETIIAQRRRSAQRSQNVQDAYDWQTTFIEGDQVSFEWGADYRSCGICKLFKEHGAGDFVRYCCFLDLPSLKSLGVGLVRTRTIAGGAEICDFRFNLRGEYSLEWYPDFYRDACQGGE